MPRCAAGNPFETNGRPKRDLCIESGFADSRTSSCLRVFV